MALLAALASLGCSVGIPVESVRKRTDFGARATVQLCVLRDETISEGRIKDVVSALNQTMDPYGIDVEVPWVRAWHRPSFFAKGIYADVERRPLEPPCDRLLALVRITTADYLWWVFPGFEYPAMVDSETHTRGWAFAGVFPPTGQEAYVNIFHYMLGCRTALTMRSCYGQIALTKGYAAAASGFFPGLTHDRHPLSRQEVDALLLPDGAPVQGN